MATNTAQISNPSISIKPSQKLKTYISKVKVASNMPFGISNIAYKNKTNVTKPQKPSEAKYLITEEDRKFVKSLNLNCKTDYPTQPAMYDDTSDTDKILDLRDLHWIYEYITRENDTSQNKVYLHELMEGSEVVLPKNEEIPRSTELEKRCKRLKAEQENRNYQHMTKNVDNSRKRLPEDTIAYQLKQMNRQLIAIFQFIVSVAAGFAFGFIGVELIIGNLDFGFRLLLGIICALTIALAELYFLAKRLNEDLQLEFGAEKLNKHVKME